MSNFRWLLRLRHFLSLRPLTADALVVITINRQDRETLVSSAYVAWNGTIEYEQVTSAIEVALNDLAKQTDVTTRRVL